MATTTTSTELPPLPLPAGITSFYIPTPELTYHVLSAGSPTNPLILLQHGFPELAFSWRKVMLPLAAAGFHVRPFPISVNSPSMQSRQNFYMPV